MSLCIAFTKFYVIILLLFVNCLSIEQHQSSIIIVLSTCRLKLTILSTISRCIIACCKKRDGKCDRERKAMSTSVLASLSDFSELGFFLAKLVKALRSHATRPGNCAACLPSDQKLNFTSGNRACRSNKSQRGFLRYNIAELLHLPS